MTAFYGTLSNLATSQFPQRSQQFGHVKSTVLMTLSMMLADWWSIRWQAGR